VAQPYIDFAYVKANASFEKVLAHYHLTTTGRGAQRSLLCPFHRERKASCKIELERRIFQCFGCGAKGNILDFVARLDDSDLRSAALKIAEVCGIDPAQPGRPRERSKDTPPAPKKLQARSAPKDAAVEAPSTAEPVNAPLTFALKLDPAHPYLSERGLSQEQVAAFGLGYCSRGVMAGRICIPIHDERGNLVAYAGRWPSEEIPEDEERYKLPAKFQKSRVLFNLNRLVPEITHIVLVEGYWSTIRLHSLGVPAAALMGTSISPEQIALLRARGTRCVALLMDGDEAGARARERVLSPLAEEFLVRSPVLPSGQKPDTLPEPELLRLAQTPRA
jgi:DNA primase